MRQVSCPGVFEVHVKRRFRLTRSTDFKRVRRSGKSYAHPFLALYVLKSSHPVTRVGVAAGKMVGNAVHRNRAKRLLRAAMNEFLPMMPVSYDLLLIARKPLAEAKLDQTRTALSELLQRAKLIIANHDD